MRYIFMTMKPVLVGTCILLQNVFGGTLSGKEHGNGDMRVLRTNNFYLI